MSTKFLLSLRIPGKGNGVFHTPRYGKYDEVMGGGVVGSYTGREISFSIQPVSPHFTMARSYVFSKEALKGFGWTSSMVATIK